MKKLMALGLAVCMTVVSAVNCFAYTKVRPLAYKSEINKFIPMWGTSPEGANEISGDDFDRRFPDSVTNGGEFRHTVVTDEFIYVNGTAMVKVRDVIAAAGGKIEYNPTTKAIKAYMPKANYTSIRSFSITPGNTKAYFSLISFNDAEIEVSGGVTENYISGSCDLKVMPEIIDGSFYVSAIDLEDILGRYNALGGTVRYNGNDNRYTVHIINNIVYIPLFNYLP